MKHFALFAALVTQGMAQTPIAKQSFSGVCIRVSDATTNQPLHGAYVAVSSAGVAGWTDELGVAYWPQPVLLRGQEFVAACLPTATSNPEVRVFKVPPPSPYGCDADVPVFTYELQVLAGKALEAPKAAELEPSTPHYRWVYEGFMVRPACESPMAWGVQVYLGFPQGRQDWTGKNRLERLELVQAPWWPLGDAMRDLRALGFVVDNGGQVIKTVVWDGVVGGTRYASNLCGYENLHASVAVFRWTRYWVVNGQATYNATEKLGARLGYSLVTASLHDCTIFRSFDACGRIQ
jgi:hypothetical protein